MPIPEEDDQKQQILQIIQDYLNGSSSFQSRGGITVPRGAVQSQIFESGTGGSGWRIEDNGNAEFNNGNFRGDITGSSGTFSGTITASAGSIGGFSIGADYIRDAANTFGMASTVTGGDDVRFWAGDSFANRASAPFRVSEAGLVTATNISITGGSITGVGMVSLSALNLANRGWSQSSVFTADSSGLLLETGDSILLETGDLLLTEFSQVSWTAGTWTSADGLLVYAISAGNTGNMSAKTFIYLDVLVSTTAYQTTTTAANALGSGRVLIASAEPRASGPVFQVLNAQGTQSFDGSDIILNSITANQIAGGTITATELSTSLLYAGSIILDTAGNVRSGQSAYNTGTGFFLGNVSGTPKFSIGDGGTTYYLTWDGSTLNVNGSLISNNDIYGDGSDGNVTISVNTTLAADKYYNNLTVNSGFTLNASGYRVFVKGTLTTVGTGAIKNVGGNGGNGADGTADGNPSAGGTSGAAAGAGFFLSGQAGAAGGGGGPAHDAGGASGNGTIGGTGSAQTNALGSNGKTGAAGGTGGVSSDATSNVAGGTAGGAGPAGTATAGSSVPRTSAELILMRDFAQTTPPKFATNAGSGGSGGGSGGGAPAGGSPGGGGGGGGGAGGSGGILLICARAIVHAGSISANGGNGGNGGAGASPGAKTQDGGGAGGGAGSGGNGGVIAMIYSTLTGSGTITTTGGSAGVVGSGGAAGGDAGTTAGSAGAAGTAGASGTTYTLIV